MVAYIEGGYILLGSMRMLILCFVALVNVLGIALLIYDKQAARKGHRRIPERVLHGVEVASAIFLMLPTMYAIHHKTKKTSYYLISWLVLAVWCVVIIKFDLFTRIF